MEKRNEISFIIICHLKNSLLVQPVAIGNCVRTQTIRSNKRCRQAGSRWWVFTVTRRDSLCSSRFLVHRTAPETGDLFACIYIIHPLHRTKLLFRFVLFFCLALVNVRHDVV